MSQPESITASTLPTDLRERAHRAGASDLSDAELVALVLATGVVGRPVGSVAQDLIGALGGLERLGTCGAHRLALCPGIGPAKAARLLAAVELGRRVALRALSDERDSMSSLDDVAAWARPRLAGLDHEEVWLLCLDGRHGLRSARRVAQGGLHGCALRPADVLRPAVEDAASGIVLVHNHPSGDPTPSLADVQMTRALAAACQILGLRLLDHVIVARSGAESLRDLALIDD
jgi:DNA repair protein RadC